MQDLYPEKAERQKRFYYSDKKGVALIKIKGLAYEGLPGLKPLDQWDFPAEKFEYYRAKGIKEDAYRAARLGINDDWIPTICPFYGVAEHTAFLGGEVVLAPTTSYNHNVLDFEDIYKIKLDPDNEWLKMVIDGMNYYRENYSESFFTKLRGASGISDIAYVLRGNDLYLDVYDEPDEILKLADFCAAAAKFYIDAQRKAATRVAGGLVCSQDCWMPENSAGHISEDGACLMNEDIYSEFFMPALLKLCENYSDILLHTHTVGAHQLNNFMKIPNLKIINLVGDPNADTAINTMRKNSDLFGNVIIDLLMTKDEIMQNLDILSEHKTIISCNIKDAKEANELAGYVNGKLGGF